jgi:hypothetical protein
VSAGNYYVIRPYAAKGFVAIKCCASAEDEPINPINGSIVWPTVQDAYDWAKNQHSEYGVHIDDTCWLRTKQLITDHSDSVWGAQYVEQEHYPSESWRNTITNLEHDVNILTARIDNQTLAIELLQDEVEHLHDSVAVLAGHAFALGYLNINGFHALLNRTDKGCACDPNRGVMCAAHDIEHDHPGG